MKKWVVFVVIAVLVLLALYGTSLGVGLLGGRRSAAAPKPTPAPSQDGDSDDGLNAPWVKTLKQRLTGRLKGEDLSFKEGNPGCRLRDERLEIPVDGECVWTIAPGERTRALRPRLVQGIAVTLTLDQEDYLEVEQGLPPADGEDAELDVYQSEDDAELTLSGCQVGEDGAVDRCLVSLKH